MEEQVIDCIVVGGGISGISFAHYLVGAGEKVLILEKEDRMGGQICTGVPATDRNFWIELGTHTCYNSYTHFLSMISEAGLQDKLLTPEKQKYMLYADGKVKGVLSEMSCWSMIPGCFRMFFSSKEGKTVREFFAPIVGQRNYNHLFRRLFRAVICQDADSYPAEFFLKKRKERVAAVSRKFSYERGFSTLVDDLVKQDGLMVRTNTPVVGITRDNDLYQVYSAQGTVFTARHVAFAVDPSTTARLVADLSPEIAGLLDSVPVSASEALGVIVRKEHIDMEKMAIMIPTSDDFLSMVSHDVHEHPGLRGFTFHFFPDGKAPEERLELACRVLGIDPGDVVESMCASHVLPSPRVEHTTLIEQIGQMAAKEHLFFLGNYYYGLSIEDCVHRSRDEFRRYRASPQPSPKERE